MKKKVNPGLSGLDIPQKIDKGKHHQKKMTGNPFFPSPIPPVATINTTTNGLELALSNAKNGTPQQTDILHKAEEAFDRIIIALASNVEYTANGDEEIIHSAGFSVKENGRGVPFILDAKNGPGVGEVILTTASIRNSAYVWEIADDPLNTDDEHWKPLKTATTAKITVSGLIPGKKYWFRVLTIYKNVEGAWSDPISIIVL